MGMMKYKRQYFALRNSKKKIGSLQEEKFVIEQKETYYFGDLRGQKNYIYTVFDLNYGFLGYLGNDLCLAFEPVFV